MSVKKQKIAALILAAGASVRYGSPKQLLPYKGTTLLEHTVKQLNTILVDKTFIVLGAHANRIAKSLNLDANNLIIFRGWEEGMGSSLAYACKTIFNDDNYDGILITLGDIPLVLAEDYQKLLQLFTNQHDIVATFANESLGVPALFGAAYFEELKQLHGKVGAKPLIQNNKKKVKWISNENAAIDIDSTHDYHNLINKTGSSASES